MKNTETKTALAPSYFRRACNSEVARLAQKLSDDFGRLGERRHVKDLAPNMRMHSRQFKPRGGSNGIDRSSSRPRGNGEAELRILLASLNELMGMCLHAWSESKHDRLATAPDEVA